MECIHPSKTCPYRKWVCMNGKCWWNCQWHCPYDDPLSECGLAQQTWGCLFLCVYDAIAEDSACPFKEVLKRQLIKDLKKGGEP